MLINEIKNSIKNAIVKVDNSIIFHFDEIKHTKFPFIFVGLKDFKIQAQDNLNKRFCKLVFELCGMKSNENKPDELFELQEVLSKSLLPVIEFKNKKIATDNVFFMVGHKMLIMNFELNFYINEENKEYELMQELDFSIKENKNAR